MGAARNADKAPKTVGKPRGPYIEIDENRVRELAYSGNPDTDIARLVSCSVDTLNRRFQDVLDVARAQRRADLRDAQWKAVLKGDKTMLVWLGKNELDQSDRTVTENNFDTFEVIIGSIPNQSPKSIASAGEVLELRPPD